MWSLWVTAGVLMCWVLLLRRTKALGLPPRRTLLWLVTAFPVGAVSAALGAGLVRLALGRGDSLAIGDATTGMTVLGAVAGCLLYSIFWARRVLRTPALPLLDAAAFTYPLALAFGRVGCLFNGCCFGVATNALPVPLAVPLAAYHPTTLAAIHHHDAPPETLLVNLPLLLALGALAALVTAQHLWHRRHHLRLRPGAVLAGTLCVEASLRFVVEFNRPDPDPGMNPWQIWTLLAAIAAGVAFAMLWRRRAPIPPPTPTPGASSP